MAQRSRHLQMAINAVIFDIGGVLVRTLDWSWRAKWEAELSLAPGELSAIVFDSEAAQLASIGQATDSDVWRSAAVRLGLDDQRVAQLRRDFWAGDALNEALLHYLVSLRPRYKTGILSNAWSEMRDLNVQHFGLAHVADATVYSFMIGVLKPDPRSFQAVLDQLNVDASDAIFVDDFAKNLHGARSVGMKPVHFQDNVQTIEEITSLLRLP
jgi:FMN phosphatase YigB (HAD superfamily)